MADQTVITRAGRAIVVAAVAVAVALGAAACGSSKKKAEPAGASPTATTATSSTTSGGKSAPTVGSQPAVAGSKGHGGTKPKQVAVMTSQFGDIINAPGGHALYVFTSDTPGRPSTCYGACAQRWPPFIVKTTPQARNAVKQGLLGTTKRSDGKLQATYDGRPLYFYVDERDPGEVLCQGVAEFGGTWYVVAPGGKPVTRT